jgi:integrase
MAMTRKLTSASGRVIKGQGSIRRRQGGLLEWRFWVRVKGRAQRLSVYGRNQTELNKERDAKFALLLGPAPQSGKSPTYEAAATAWLQRCRQLLDQGELSFKTFGQYQQLTIDYIAPVIGGLLLDKLTLEDLELVLDEASAAESAKTAHLLRKQTIQHIFSTLRRSLYYAQKRGWTTLNVPALMEALGERVSVTQYKPYRLNEKQLLRFHAAAAQCEYGFVFTVLLAVLGREAEVLGMRMKHIDEPHRVVHIREELQFLPKALRPKDDAFKGAVIVDRVKTPLDAERAKLEVGPKFFDAIRNARKEVLRRRSNRIAKGESWQDTIRVMVEGRLSDLREVPNDLLVVTEDGRPMQPKVLRDHFNKICERANIPYSERGKEGLRIHDLRGSGAVLLLTDGAAPMSPTQVMRRGRWNSWQMLKYYTEIWEQAQSVVAERADRLAFG